MFAQRTLPAGTLLHLSGIAVELVADTVVQSELANFVALDALLHEEEVEELKAMIADLQLQLRQGSANTPYIFPVPAEAVSTTAEGEMKLDLSGMRES
jgi:hypothetical protein